MKKILLFALALMMIMLLSVPALAAEPCASCSHDYECVSSIDMMEYYDTTYHKKVTVKTYVCSKCADSYQTRTTSNVNYAHSSTYVTASCNGYVQSHVMNCSQCHTTYTVTVTCPKAPHTGLCPLPV